MVLPIILGIGAAIGSAITAGEAAAIGVGLGAIGAGMLMKNKNQNTNQVSTSDDEKLEELVELLVQHRLKKAGKGTRSVEDKLAA